ncbi:MAG TPA: NeuD/PglB/VioB family sugar acetyltransferase [Cytophagaceae bacterium]|nr:NeuD/PglB/VioB family sugar acetyltransferase [Cytophagaceae bacterium]
MENPVIIFGAKGLGRVALDIFQSNDVIVYCLLDDDTKLHNTEINGVSVLGSTDNDGFLKLIGKKCEAFVATDDNKLKAALVEMLQERRKVMPVNAFHKNISLAPSAFIGHGNMFNAGVVVNANAKINNYCIIGSNAVIEYDAEIGDMVQIGAGSIIGAGAKIGKGAFIGSGVTIVAGVTIGKNARIGAGSIVIAEVKDSETVFGNPAQKVK